MMGCNEIRKQIDEADRPDVFSFEVTGHIASCKGCSGFADERARLRGMLASSARVQAPAGFDAALRSRLETAKSRRSFSWLAPAALMRIGAAAAAVVIVVFVAQYALFPTKQTPPDQARTNNQASSPIPAPPPVAAAPQSQSDSNTTAAVQQTQRVIERAPSRSSKRDPSRVDPNDALLDSHLVVVRGERGDREVPIFTVSVGAQPHLYGASSEPQARLAKASF